MNVNNNLKVTAANYNYTLSIHIDDMCIGDVEKPGTYYENEEKIIIPLSKDKKLSFDIGNKKVFIDGEEEIRFDVFYNGNLLLFFKDITEAVNLLIPDNNKDLVKLKRFIDNCCSENITLNDGDETISIKKDILHRCVYALVDELF